MTIEHVPVKLTDLMMSILRSCGIEAYFANGS